MCEMCMSVESGEVKRTKENEGFGAGQPCKFP